MAREFITLTPQYSEGPEWRGTTVDVQTRTIRYYHTNVAGDGSSIHFGPDDELLVAETVGDIRELLGVPLPEAELGALIAATTPPPVFAVAYGEAVMTIEETEDNQISAVLDVRGIRKGVTESVPHTPENLNKMIAEIMATFLPAVAAGNFNQKTQTATLKIVRRNDET